MFLLKQSQDKLPSRARSSAELHKGWLTDGELTVAYRIAYENNLKQVYCPLFDEGTKKPVKKQHFIYINK